MKTKLPALLILVSAIGQIFPAHAKQPYAQGPLLGIIGDMPEGSWKKVNANAYAEAWAPADLRPLYKSSNPTPQKIITAWSGFAWDSNRGDLILYGGGHANYSGNDVYRWRSRNLQWERAALPSELTPAVTGVPDSSIDGADAAPVSAHTYDNAMFLPVVDRYLNFGGASYNTGAPYQKPSETNPSVYRVTGPYFFDPAKSNPNQVGGTTGSHVQRVAPHPEILGGGMWQNRDFVKNLAGKSMPVRHVNGCTAYVEELGRDVVYVAGGISGSSTSPDLFRYVPGDVTNPGSDDITRVGIYWSGTSGQTVCAADPKRQVLLRTGVGTKPFMFWNLATSGPTNKDVAVSVSGDVSTFVNWLSANGKDIRSCALDYDPVRERFLLWCGDEAVWSIVPPTPMAATGWKMAPVQSGGIGVPPGQVGVGILGKWKYIPGYDVFLGLQDDTEGQIWIYKPVGWGAPNTDNLAPNVSLLNPLEGSEVLKGEVVSLTSDATDADGTVSRVDYTVNGSLVGSSTVPPYLVSWTPLAIGTVTVKAIATDNSGAEAESSPVSFMVKSPSPSSEPVTTILQRGVQSYTASSDTYLDKYGQSTSQGSRDVMLYSGSNYTPLIKFAIFEREGGRLPDNAIIQSAKLHIYKAAYDYVYRLHPMLRDWSELEATWTRPRTGEVWAVAGATGVDSDYAATPDGQVSAAFNPAWMVFDVTARLVAFQQGQSNFGWRLVGVSGNGNLKKLYTSEYAVDVTLRPKLEVIYTTE